MSESNLTIDFQLSCRGYLSYPSNLVRNGTKVAHCALEAYKGRLDDVVTALCVENEDDALVPIRDLYSNENIGTELGPLSFFPEMTALIPY